MKIYRNKLYSITDAAKRAGIPEIAIVAMIIDKFINSENMFNNNIHFIRGENIPGLKGKWKEYQEKLDKKKKPIKNTKVTMLRMDKGD